MTNPVNQVAFLRTTRDFPEDPVQLAKEVNRTYIDVAGATNSRTIGIYPTSRPAITGNAYFYDSNKKQQSLRQMYVITGTGNTLHGIKLSNIAGFASIYGAFTDGTDWYPLPYVNEANANNQISLKITEDNIVITAGSGTPPTISSGFVFLEWISFV